MTWSFKDENNIRPPKAGVLVRRYPFPYLAALTISNDTDRMRIDAFDDLHDYVNGTGDTPYGPGLGLEMSDSFWIWSESGCLSLFHSSPFEKDTPLSPEADRVIALAKSGVIDMLHNFGQWEKSRNSQYMKRDDAKRALDILDRYGLAPRIWVNHGGDLRMRHQMEGRWGFKRFGDDPENESYCYDLVRDAGFLFFSHGMMAEQHRFGEHRLYREQAEFDQDYGSYDFNRWFRRYNRLEQRYLKPYGELSEEQEVAIKRKLFNKILVPEEAKDGTPMLLFKRFRGIDRPSAGSFVTQVNFYSLRDLVRRRACAVIYQHLGVKRPALSDPSRSSGEFSKPPVLDWHNRVAFEYLAEYERSGEIWVPAQLRFLEFMRVRDFMDFEVLVDGESIKIVIGELQCPSEGSTRLTLDDLNGIAFVLPQDAADCRIFLGGNEISRHFKRDLDNIFRRRPVVYSKYTRRAEYIASKYWYRTA
jgi:hypothetical protein